MSKYCAFQQYSVTSQYSKIAMNYTVIYLLFCATEVHLR